jgi:hypothetical protein
MDYEWLPGKGQTSVEPDHQPRRLAATITALIGDADGRLLLLNPHPDSWNNWQLPYASITRDLEQPLKAATLETIEAALTQAVDLGDPATQQQATEQIAALLGNATVTLASRPALETFALRYSKTANVWTAYRFAYIAGAANATSTAIAHTWLDPADDQLATLLQTKELDGLAVSDNILTILADAQSRKIVTETLARPPAT